MNFKKLASVGIFGLITTLLVASSIAPISLADNDNDDTIEICHATGSQQNPYNVQHPSKSGDLSGHDGHNGGVYPANPWGDIIPPFSRPGPDYPGKNWTSQGQAIYNNDCNIPTPWSVQITETAFACGVSEVTIQGTAQYGDDSSTTLLVKVNGNVVLDSESETTNWSKTINVVPGQTYTVFAYVYDKSNPDVTGDHQDTPKATDTWQFTIAECQNPIDVCGNIDGNQSTLPDGYYFSGENVCTPKVHVCREEIANNYDQDFNEQTEVADNQVCTYDSQPYCRNGETVLIPENEQPQEGDVEGRCVVEPTATPTPTLTPAPTSSEVPPSPHGDGLSDGGDTGPKKSEPAPSTGQVLGASTMAGTGTFEQNLMNSFAIFGMLLLTAGYKSYAKEKAKI